MTQDPTGSPPPFDPAQSKRINAALFALLLGGFGAHRFYLGDTKGGIIRFVLCCIGPTISLIEGIIYLTKTDEQFYQDYIVNKKEWF